MASEMTLPAGGGEGMKSSTRHRWRHFFGLLGGYFTSSEWPFAWAMLLILVGLTFGGVQSAVGLAEWSKSLFDAIGARQYDRIFGIMVTWAYLTAGLVFFQLSRTFLQGVLQIRWRTWLTNDYTRRYLANARVYEIEQRGIADNPDQRIAEDINLFLSPSGGVLSLVFLYLQIILSLFSFTRLLWAQSRPLTFTLAGNTVSIPGDFVIYTYAYGIISFSLIYFIGKPLIRRTMILQKVEADFRFALTNIRRAAEQIAFYRAAAIEWRRLVDRFARVRHSFLTLLYARMYFEGSNQVLSSIQAIVPLMASLPRYFAGTMTLGDVQMSTQLFAGVQSALGTFSMSYAQVAGLVATVNRLHLLDQEIAHPREGDISATSGGAAPVMATDLAVTLPDGEPLVALDQWHVRPGERWSIQGPSGAGKSTLLRTLAGLWPYGSGAVSLGAQRAMFVPQQLYTPDGTLKELLAFPADADAFDDDACVAALQKARLPRLAGQLGDYRSWSRELSPGEQQRVAFARIVLHKPEILFLDEATSALDPDNAIEMYMLLGRELPGLTLVSIVHDQQLAAAHNHHLDVRDGRATILAA